MYSDANNNSAFLSWKQIRRAEAPLNSRKVISHCTKSLIYDLITTKVIKFVARTLVKNLIAARCFRYNRASLSSVPCGNAQEEQRQLLARNNSATRDWLWNENLCTRRCDVGGGYASHREIYSFHERSIQRAGMRNFCIRVARGAAQHERGNAIRRHANPCTGSMLNFQGAYSRINASRMESSIRQFFGSSTQRRDSRRKRRRSGRVSGVPITESRWVIVDRKINNPPSWKAWKGNFRARTMWLRLFPIRRHAFLRSLILSA